ncbi:MAG TPA: hypothetical protein VEW91_07590 [bacterium]|nr:hypothetical protein [bacterium]
MHTDDARTPGARWLDDAKAVLTIACVLLAVAIAAAAGVKLVLGH